jgi:selenide,water dikinase
MIYKLTQYSHGAGCGCKISPKVLSEILGTTPSGNGKFPALLVGNDQRDDAAAYDLGDGTAIISTTDFFMPIVDDPATFGHIASVNAISDIYAMGGEPLLAIAVLGWPVDKLPAAVASKVVEGARAACAKAGIPLAGGHSIDSPEPIFGLAVTGRVKINRLKKNGGARPGDLIYLTKPLGIGVYTTAQKKGYLSENHHTLACEVMMQLNTAGAAISGLKEVHAMTDVTGFGLGGHLLEMCDASSVSAQIRMEALPLLDREAIAHYVGLGCIPGGTHRNFDSYGDRLILKSEDQKYIICDPQTSGGLLIAVDPEEKDKVDQSLHSLWIDVKPIGIFIAQSGDHPEIHVV